MLALILILLFLKPAVLTVTVYETAPHEYHITINGEVYEYRGKALDCGDRCVFVEQVVAEVEREK